MARIQMNYTSVLIRTSITLDILLPETIKDAAKDKKTFGEYAAGKEYPVLWLLHGAGGDGSDWPRFSRAEALAVEKELVIVCPTCFDPTYSNMAHGYRWLDYIGVELYDLIRTMLPVSGRREDHFIAGLSMGGYGAYKLALTFPEKYAGVAGLSGAYEIPQDYEKGTLRGGEKLIGAALGDKGKVLGGKNDIFALAEKRAAQGGPLPKAYLTCGRDDFCLESEERFYAHLKQLGYDVSRKDYDGYSHQWDFWSMVLAEAAEALMK